MVHQAVIYNQLVSQHDLHNNGLYISLTGEAKGRDEYKIKRDQTAASSKYIACIGSEEDNSYSSVDSRI